MSTKVQRAEQQPSAAQPDAALPTVALELLAGLIREVGNGLPEIGELVETRKWDQQSFLPKKARVGTTVRIAAPSPTTVAMYVHCQTTLVDQWRGLFPELTFEGNRALVMDATAPLPLEALKVCVRSALLYHLAKRNAAGTRR